MKFLKISAAALIATGILTGSAMASDLLDGKYENEADSQIHTYFQGIAVGIHGGGQFTSVRLNDEEDYFDGISSDGLIGGAHLEYLFAVNSFRIGAYAEGGFSNVNTGIGAPDFDLLQQDSYYGGGLKAGVVVGGNTLLFARFGYDWSQWQAFEAVDADVQSWVIGGGAETMITDNLSLGVEADYLLVNDVEAASTDLSDLFDESEMIRAKVRLTWRQ